MPTHTIVISIVGNHLQVSHPTVTASRGVDRVEWICDHHWAVEFNTDLAKATGTAPKHTPFGPQNSPQNKFHGGPGQPDGDTVHLNANTEHFRYTVAAWDDGHSRVLTLDPDLDIV